MPVLLFTEKKSSFNVNTDSLYLYIVVPPSSSSVRLIFIEKGSLLYTIRFPAAEGVPKLGRSSEFRWPKSEGICPRSDRPFQNRTFGSGLGRALAHIVNYL